MFQSDQRPVAAVRQPRKLMGAVLSAALLGLAVLALWQQFEIQRLDAAGARAPGMAPPVSVRRVHGPRIVVAPLRSARAIADTPYESRWPEAGFGRATRGADAGGSRGEPPTSLMEDPEFLRAFEQYREGMLDARYAGLFRQLKLDPGDLAAFKHLLAEKDNMLLDVVAINQAAAGPVPADVLQAGLQTAQTDIDNSIRSTLGRERYDVYRDYEDTLAQRATVEQLESRLSYSSTPLTAGQADGMIKILAQHPPQQSAATVPAVSLVVGAEPSGVMPVVKPNAAGLVTDEAIAQAQLVLSPQQVTALRQIQMEQQAVLQASRLILDSSPYAPTPQINWALLLQ